MIFSKLLAPERPPKTMTSNSLPRIIKKMNGILKLHVDEGAILAPPTAAAT